MNENFILLGVLNVIEAIQNTSKRLEKEKIIKDNVHNVLLKDIFYFVYNPYIITGISDNKLNKNVTLTNTINIFYIKQLLTYLQKNNTGKDVDIANVKYYLDQKNSKLGSFIKKIITKNLKIGVTSKTLNKIYSHDFIPFFDVMLAKNYNDYKKELGYFHLTEKLNGMRCVLIKDHNSVKCMTRQGLIINDLVEIEKDVYHLPDNFVYDGELIAINNENLNSEDLFRKTISIARKDEIKNNLVFNIFDMIQIDGFKKGKSKLLYLERRALLDNMNLQRCKFINIVPVLYFGNDESKIKYYLDQSVREGKEGLMLNFSDSSYECKRTDNILKVVKYNKADVKVIDFIEGKNKNKGKLGALVFKFDYKGKTYTSECGSGFSDKERVKYWENKNLLKYKIVTIEYKGISRDKTGKYSIRNSSWKSVIRNDKTETSLY